MKNEEVKISKRKKKNKINIQKIFNIISAMFILACCIFYGGRFLILYLENNQIQEIKTFADSIIENNTNSENFKKINNDYYFNGNNVDNYLTYSNLIWRIIKVNSDNTITAVLDNSITSLAPANKSYTQSYINTWLNNTEDEYTGILESSLNNANKYLTYTNTCNDIVNNIKNISCKEKTENILITIPSLNDYANTGNSNSFMNNGEYYYLINTNKENKWWYVNNEGKLNTSDGTDIMGIKPLITFKKTLELIQGDGSKENPYKIENENGLFGSYVKLGNDIWRVYNIKGDNIKLSLDTYLKINNNDAKYKYSNKNYYHDDKKEGSLAHYLKNTYLPTLTYNDIINEEEYSNGIYSNITNYNYIKTLKAKTKTKVSTLSIGDIFLNSSNTNYYTSTGLSENSNLIYIMKNDFKLYTETATTNLRIIPVISINKNLLTKGNGTIDSPLEVE